MIKKNNIIKSVSRVLNSEYPNIAIFVDRIQAYNNECFYIGLDTLGRDSEAQFYVNKRLTIEIVYTNKQQDNISTFNDMEDKLLDEVFTDYLDIDGIRFPRLENQNAVILDNELHITMDIYFIDELKEKGINYGTMEKLIQNNELKED